MDYLKLLNGLKNEFIEAGKTKYKSLFIVWRILLTILFIPLRIGFFFGRLSYWLTWFFFKCLATPVEYLQKWLNNQQEGIHPASPCGLRAKGYGLWARGTTKKLLTTKYKDYEEGIDDTCHGGYY